jgi:hypothetical protein
MRKREQIDNTLDDNIRDILNVSLGSNFRNQMFSRIYRNVSARADLLHFIYYYISTQKVK